MILTVTFLQAQTKTSKLKENKNIHKLLTNSSYGVHKRQVYYNQKKGKEAKQNEKAKC